MTTEQNTFKPQKILLFFISQSVTLFGSTLVQMAMIWYVALKTSSGTWVAALTVCAYLPQFLISFPAGVWADRHSRKLLIIAADAVIAAATLLLWLAMPALGNGTTLLWGIILISVIRSCGAGVQMPAVNAVIPQLVPEEQLMRYNGINATMQSVVQFAAPAAAGAVLTFFSLRSAFLIDIFTAIAGIAILFALAVPGQKAIMEKKPLLEDIKIGLRYTFGNGFLRTLLGLYGTFIFLSVPAGFLATLFVSREFGGTYFYLTAVEIVGFIGMTGGGLLLGAWGGWKNHVKTLLIAVTTFGFLGVGLGAAPNFPFYLFLMLLYGVALTMVQTATTTLIQERADESMQGRVFGLLSTIYSGFLPLGMVLFGPLADVASLRLIMIISGAVLIGVAVLCRFLKSFYTVVEKGEA